MDQDLKLNPLFQRLSSAHLDLLESLSKHEHYPKGHTLLTEGETSMQYYLLLKGEVEIVKVSEEGTEHRIRTLSPGDLIGELAFIEETPRSATVRTLSETDVVCIDGATIKTDPRYVELYAALAVTIGKSISERLRYTNTVTVKAMQAELSTAKLQIAMGYGMMTIISLTSFIIFMLGIIGQLKYYIASYMPSSTPLTVAFLLIFSVGVYIAIRGGGYPWSNYGFTTLNWRSSIVQAIQYSIPYMLLLLLIKWLFICYVPEYHDDALFQPMVGIPPSPTIGRWLYVILIGAYLLFTPVQEFIVRGALQSSLRMFLKGGTADRWKAIILSNLLFSSGHVLITFGFAMMAFIPGLFWGWLYDKQRNLIGVSVSHAILGVWVAFVVGFKTLI
jgi:CRP-like cAMP-binding protein